MSSKVQRVSVRALMMAFVAAALLSGVACTSDSPKPAARELTGYTRSPLPSAAAVTMPKADGSGDWAMMAKPGGLRVMYFGYTSCPDVCPTTMSDLKRGLLTLSKTDRARVDVGMATIDPTVDTAAKMVEYVTTFIPDGVALRSEDPKVLAAAAAPFGASYSVKPGKNGVPEVSHSGDLYLVNDKGNIILQWPFGTAAKDLGADIEQLLRKQQTTTADSAAN